MQANRSKQLFPTFNYIEFPNILNFLNNFSQVTPLFSELSLAGNKEVVYIRAQYVQLIQYAALSQWGRTEEICKTPVRNPRRRPRGRTWNLMELGNFRLCLKITFRFLIFFIGFVSKNKYFKFMATKISKKYVFYSLCSA